MRNKMIALLAMAGVLTFLSGCTQVNQEINSDSTGFWNEYIVWPLSQTLLFFADLFSGSYGLSIIVVTIIIRLILLPLNIKQLKSSKAMQDIQPELQSLREQYSSKDAQTQQKLQQETMQLFQKHGVNPLAGCLPIIVQMPILIGFYHAIMRTSEIQTHNFLWLELGSSDPFLAILTAGTTFLQQKLMMAGGAAAQNPQMQMMLYVMPLMIGTFAFFFPSALALYWIVGNIVMILQTVFIRKPMMKDATGGASE
ncbi:YidC family membrane integrase SpoIIIJ [Halobacillus litoralis]|uniref:Membrane protein insertase YidC n=1 Tax=Halobacillus litoralis TaxID=45668 RepID=A0A845E4X0_9BACI|nr:MULTISPECIES: YidC family membrane integrase SpoIIIJ [Halobacillus]MCA1020481.1 YidC family membrane integrase SpoIIIJ [Halobacillus litoralis]MYL20704.1 YidC family membrane integrase SpoIIIJ [Halobacillus litoralis]MYL29794.1 YidC family membrane integrase SpoIIIJ [Halobacillus halophilus]MYL39294.1 YidC family membrane integrase SpoIIIJ [Halobacillus litoralis]